MKYIHSMVQKICWKKNPWRRLMLGGKGLYDYIYITYVRNIPLYKSNQISFNHHFCWLSHHISHEALFRPECRCTFFSVPPITITPTTCVVWFLQQDVFSKIWVCPEMKHASKWFKMAIQGFKVYVFVGQPRSFMNKKNNQEVGTPRIGWNAQSRRGQCVLHLIAFAQANPTTANIYQCGNCQIDP